MVVIRIGTIMILRLKWNNATNCRSLLNGAQNGRYLNTRLQQCEFNVNMFNEPTMRKKHVLQWFKRE